MGAIIALSSSLVKTVIGLFKNPYTAALTIIVAIALYATARPDVVFMVLGFVLMVAYAPVITAMRAADKRISALTTLMLSLATLYSVVVYGIGMSLDWWALAMYVADIFLGYDFGITLGMWLTPPVILFLLGILALLYEILLDLIDGIQGLIGATNEAIYSFNERTKRVKINHSLARWQRDRPNPSEEDASVYITIVRLLVTAFSITTPAIMTVTSLGQ